MGYIKKLKNNELVGGTDKTTIYPVTSTEAVFEEITEGSESNFKSQKTINGEHDDRIKGLENEMPDTVKSITINGGQRVNRVDENGNVDLTIYSDGGQDYESLTEVVADLRDIVGENPEEPQSGTLLERVDTLEDAVGTVDQRISDAVTIEKNRAESIEGGLQTKLSVGAGITLTSDGVISATADPSVGKVVEAKPMTDIVDGIIYLVQTETPGTYKQWVHSNGEWVDKGNISLSITTDSAISSVSTNPIQNDAITAQIGYFVCSASGSSAIKEVDAPSYSPSDVGGAFKIKMNNTNTCSDTVYLQFNSNASTKKELRYNREPVTPTNTWDSTGDNKEVISVYYDGTYYQASNAQGGGGKAEKIKYDNSEKAFTHDNVQGVLDEVGSRTIAYTKVWDGNPISFSTTSSVKSFYDIRGIIPFMNGLGKTFKMTFTLDSAKSVNVELYLANSSNRSASGLARIFIGAIQAGNTTKTIYYTCNDTTMLYPSLNCESATEGTLSIMIEEQSLVNTEIVNTNSRIDGMYIDKDVVAIASDGTEISGLNISPTKWVSESSRKIQAIPVDDCESVTIETDSTEAYYSFLTSIAHGTSTPVYYCKGYTGWVVVSQDESETIDVPELAKYIIIYKSYGGAGYFPKKLTLHKKVSPSSEMDDVMDVVEELSDNTVNEDSNNYALTDWRISSGNNPVWQCPDADSRGSNTVWAKMIPLSAGTYKISAANGIAIYAVLRNGNYVLGATPDWATGYEQRYTLSYGESAEITAQDGWYLWCRADKGEGVTPSAARFPVITCLSKTGVDLLEKEIYLASRPTNAIVVAASNSSEYDKRRADLVCTGTDDNKVIETAIGMIGGTKGTVYLCNGTYYVTSFTQEPDGTYVGIIVPGKEQRVRQVNIEGYFYGGGTNGTANIRLSEEVYNALDADSKYSIIRHKYNNNGYNLNYHLVLKHLSFTIYSNQKKITVIDCSCTSQINMEDVSGGVSTQAGVWGNAEQQAAFTPASINCVFFRGLVASGNGWDTLRDCYCECYGVGFGIQGEHMIAETCIAVNCIYGFAFNYFPNIGSSAGMYVHPMIIINPVEEGCFNYPYFGDNPQKQSINIIGYHNEHRPFFFSPDINGGGNTGGNYATEKVPGQWYGHVDYAIQYFPDSQSHGTEMHAVGIPFWASGSGVNMESRNMVHKSIATSAIRRTYAPNYAQQIFDTTANKLLICTDPTNNTWVDVNGNVVQ